MIEQNRLEKIKELIKRGFDLELLSFELDIPIEDIKDCKEQIEKERNENKPKRRTKRKKFFQKWN